MPDKVPNNFKKYVQTEEDKRIEQIIEESRKAHAKKMKKWKAMKDQALIKEIQSLAYQDDDLIDQDTLFDLQYAIDILAERYGITPITDTEL